MKIYDITNAIVTDNELVVALFDGREEGAIMIIKPVLQGGVPKLKASEPDGLERYQWLEEFGLLPEKKLTKLYKKVKTEEERRAIYNTLNMEFDTARVSQLEAWEDRLKVRENSLREKELK